MLHTFTNGEETIVELDFAEQRESSSPLYRPSWPASSIQLASNEPSQRTSIKATLPSTSPTRRITVCSVRQAGNRLETEISLALSFHLQGSDHLVLELKAAPAVHSEQSAKLQLRQVAALLQSYHADAQQHALSVDRFDWKLRAADNTKYQHLPDPEHIQGRHTDRLETEFEFFAESAQMLSHLTSATTSRTSDPQDGPTPR